ncbi:mucin-5AC-like [Rosa chinensis]|uniref:mucin-5AC-like n=1 Tax=Rosa chinensis TaxID=74649 RepID=UPI000D08EAC3|nr:mucin-5AC-like [Rosa chinensis]
MKLQISKEETSAWCSELEQTATSFHSEILHKLRQLRLERIAQVMEPSVPTSSVSIISPPVTQPVSSVLQFGTIDSYKTAPTTVHDAADTTIIGHVGSLPLPAATTSTSAAVKTTSPSPAARGVVLEPKSVPVITAPIASTTVGLATSRQPSTSLAGLLSSTTASSLCAPLLSSISLSRTSSVLLSSAAQSGMGSSKSTKVGAAEVGNWVG